MINATQARNIIQARKDIRRKECEHQVQRQLCDIEKEIKECASEGQNYCYYDLTDNIFVFVKEELEKHGFTVEDRTDYEDKNQQEVKILISWLD